MKSIKANITDITRQDLVLSVLKENQDKRFRKEKAKNKTKKKQEKQKI